MLPPSPILEPQPCPVCGSLIGLERIIIGPVEDAGAGRFTRRVRLYCEHCEGVAARWMETRAEFAPWRWNGQHRYYDGRSRELRRMQRELARRMDSGIRTG